MFRKSRKKIVLAIMSVLVLLFLGTLAVIYVVSYVDVSQESFSTLRRYAEIYSLSNDGHDMAQPEKGAGTHSRNTASAEVENLPKMKLSTFYSVAVSYQGDTLAVNTAGNDMYEEAQLEAYALTLLEKSEDQGIKDNLLYYVCDKGGYTLVVFMDNTITRSSMTTLFRYTLIFGSVAIVALFILAVHLANHIVAPLEESYQKQKQFISDASHELKTPIAVVNANIELLSREIGENQWLSNIQYEGERMSCLVTQLLELSRMETVEIQTEYLDFSRLVSGGVLPFECVAFEKGLFLQTQIADNIHVMGNASQLSQLVSVLTDNAIRHGSGGKEVQVNLTEKRNTAVLSVINSGEAIPPDRREQLFERFYRVDEARSSQDQHYGLGLAIAKAIVTAHKGKIELFCDHGLVEFCVSIPKA